MEQRSQEWFNARKHKITASAVGAILGVAPYQKSQDVMRRMVREYHGYESEFKGNSATEWGTFNEAGAIAEFEMETGLKVEPAPFVVGDTIDYLGASPDGYVSDESLIEVKCPYGLRDGGEFKSITEQPHYHAQMQLQMFCTKKHKCYFFQWAPHNTMLEVVERDDDYIVEMLDALDTFYRIYLKEREFPYANKYLDEHSDELEAMMKQYIMLKDEKKAAEDLMKELLQGMVTLTDEAGGTIAGHKLYKTEKQGAISYAKAIKELLPDADLEPYRGQESVYWSVK